MTLLPYFTRNGQARFPASELLALASTCVRDLYWHYDIERRKHEASGDESAESDAMESQQDASTLVKAIVPTFWAHIGEIDRYASPKDFPAEQAADESTRLKELLSVGVFPKAWFWIADAVKHHRSNRPAGMAEVDMKKEDVLLDLLVFMAEKRERAALFELVE
ncbi:hypothetical protein OF83DRAFT_1067265 [Amylostereum chailletii]|nr:hypothetical protein OF83DRAFT_1067265 [Amylostereum chailletii]